MLIPKRKLPWGSDHEAIVWLMAVLLIVGMVNVFSSTFITAENENSAPYAYLLKHLISMGIGFVLFAMSWRVDYHKWRDWLGPVALSIAALLLFVLAAGTVVNGAKRWIYLGAFSFQPAEFAKICSVMIAAYILSYRVEHKLPINILNAQYAFIAFLFVAVEMEPDMGTACVILGIPIVMLWMAGLKTYKLQRLALVGLAAVVGMCIYQPYRLERIKVMFNPWSDAQGMGYQTVQSVTAIGSGGVWGMGLGQGLAKYAYLPEAHTDFAFAVFCQENGFLLTALVLLLYGAFAYYAVRIARDAYDAYGQLLAGGIMLLVVGQAVVNIAMVAGCFPVVGVPLPFISYGGTSLMMTMFSVGVLINIGRYSQAKQAKEKLDELRCKNLKNHEAALAATPGRRRLQRIK
ncbi:MAG: putative peptidoglycan glycosyltransferase FtsW [Anaerovibrio sp.]|uniref:FtsW/RodA/SpoVE family cell cycle protein n=1 Tax=Anaerovibrio sp. TaxID=1872532 RepID=UPI0026188270|nr:putative peptidoglycan glycosyltransferase FtsW [Anaerovibrio sp.]MDD7678294.1 putative peptidoglycan glycosyltransferase FtsW [Anaerovibrio sp.]MDY2602999.1 putative peptidoglycan glycosyltransferase FtsW [Anaerovibrio sp.]